ncbi:MAG: bile acid:sodium symporter family protein [Gammaproteobacteria bacterium]
MHRSMLLFPLSAILFSAIAYGFPQIFLPLKQAIIPFLVVIMFCMGITLTIDDFRRVLQSPKVIALGVVMQYAIMPLAAFALGTALGLSIELVIGMVLVGSSPGGTASNVMCYLAKADVALSITLTMVSTLLAIFATPLLTLLYVGEHVPIPVMNMLLSILKIVVIPVALGVVLNTFFARQIQPMKHYFPVISMIAIIIIIAVIVALNQDKLANIGVIVFISVVLHNAVGLTSGYAISRALGYNEKTSRTLAIEVGMQNSGLAVALASQYFTAISALPGAVFSIWHNISGSLLAGFWNRKS